jgi:hypothetical protein
MPVPACAFIKPQPGWRNACIDARRTVCSGKQIVHEYAIADFLFLAKEISEGNFFI